MTTHFNPGSGRRMADVIASEMLRLYLMFWMPRVILHVESGTVELGGGWLNADAENLYKRLESMLVQEREVNHEQR